MLEELYNVIFIIIAWLILCRPHFSIDTLRAKNMSIFFAFCLIPSGYSLVLLSKYIIKGEKVRLCQLRRRGFMPRAEEVVDVANSSHFGVWAMLFTFQLCVVLPYCTFTYRQSPLPVAVLENSVSTRAGQIRLKIDGF